MCIAVAHSEVVLNPLPDADDEDRVRPTGDTRRKLTDVLQRDSVRRPLTAMLNSRVAIQIRLVNKYDIILLHKDNILLYQYSSEVIKDNLLFIIRH